MKISLIVPVFNGMKYFDMFQSNINEIYHDSKFEIIIVDDGSNDDFLKQIISTYPKIKSLRQKNHGSGIARNNGITNAHGDFIMFMDVDDKIIKSELDIAISMIRRGVDIYFFKAKRIIHEDVIIERTWKPELFFHDYTGPAFKKPNIVIDTIVMNKIFSRDFIIGNSIKFPSGKYEDKIFMTEILLKNPIIHISDISYYRWLVYPNAGSQTNVKNLDDVIQRFNACEKQLQLSKETPFFIETFSNIFNHDITLYSKNFESHCIEIKEELYHRLCHFRCLPKKPTLSKLGKAVYESKDFSSFCAIMNTPSIIPSTTRDKFIKWSSKILDSFRLHKKLSH